ncbi:1330_t:CDS:2 [Funneliformis mosseae]|uniref:1330_t:CDS:1 n=1 Tax=Funneliformis mosseae TaxID=27381 RepID=A0A9N9DIU1_FUNMO|nr:1330_t:CDS:2 [Funneliformis mosseae]
MTTTHKHNNKPSQKVKSKVVKIKMLTFVIWVTFVNSSRELGKKIIRHTAGREEEYSGRRVIFSVKKLDLLKEENVAVIELTLPKLLFWSTAGKKDYPDTAGARRVGVSRVLLGKRTAWILLGKSGARPVYDGLEPTAL